MAILGFRRPALKLGEDEIDVKSPEGAPPACVPIQKTPLRPTISPNVSSRRRSFQSQRHIKRQIYHQHLIDWASNHDSSAYFNGKLSLPPHSSNNHQEYELGKSVHAILTDSTFPDARVSIVIRLFPAQGLSKDRKSRIMSSNRRDSMDPLEECSSVWNTEKGAAILEENWYDSTDEHSASSMMGHYKLFVRCGAGWVDARGYLDKWFFFQQATKRSSSIASNSLDDLMQKRSEALGPVPLDKDSIIIRPLFRPFLRLPVEVQELILNTAAGLTRTFNLYSDEYGSPKLKKLEVRSPISLATLFGISKAMNESIVPHVYHSTDFKFGLTGFTNFLWQSGPKNRPEIRRLTFHFGKMALLHCIRWLAPDPIFTLFEPPVATNPRSLQYFWRCQIQDLIKDLHLLTLTIDITSIPSTELGMVIAIMKGTFGSVERLRFVETNNEGRSTLLDRDDLRITNIIHGKSWRTMCQEYYARHRKYSYFYKFELLRGEMAQIDKVMEEDKFFDECPV